jgi:cell division topological specificity factor
VIDFLKKLFGQSATSSSTAKERLRLVLMTDHLELAPEMIDAMKRDLVDVISRYVEVDREKIEVNFEQQDKALAMLANIPILSVNRTNGTVVAPSEPAAPVSAPEPQSAPAGAAAPDGVKRRRRRRRKAKAPEGSAPLEAAAAR